MEWAEERSEISLEITEERSEISLEITEERRDMRCPHPASVTPTAHSPHGDKTANVTNLPTSTNGQSAFNTQY